MKQYYGTSGTTAAASTDSIGRRIQVKTLVRPPSGNYNSNTLAKTKDSIAPRKRLASAKQLKNHAQYASTINETK